MAGSWVGKLARAGISLGRHVVTAYLGARTPNRPEALSEMNRPAPCDYVMRGAMSAPGRSRLGWQTADAAPEHEPVVESAHDEGPACAVSDLYHAL